MTGNMLDPKNRGLMLFKCLFLMTLDSYNICYAKYRIASGCGSTYFRIYSLR